MSLSFSDGMSLLTSPAAAIRYLKKSFPNLDYILSAKITEEKT